jgi:hypothetical protein
MVSHFRMPLGHWTRETVPKFGDRFALFRVLGVSRSTVSLRVLVTPAYDLFYMYNLCGALGYGQLYH